MALPCPRGHRSTDTEFCSECGARMSSPISSAVPRRHAKSTPEPNGHQVCCPDCGTTQARDARYCEVCRYDFETLGATVPGRGSSAGSQPVMPIASALLPALEQTSMAGGAPIVVPTEPPVPGGEAGRGFPVRQRLLVENDPEQARQLDVHALCPPAQVVTRFTLDLAQVLVGRRSERRGIYPELDICDTGVSHRHLLLNRQGEGTFVVLDLGSANGTRLNGVELAPNVATAVKAGDVLRLGMWTRITIEDQ